MPAPVEPLLCLWLLSAPALAEPKVETPLPDPAMLEFLATFASEDGQLTDPETIEQMKLKEETTPADAERKPTNPTHQPGTQRP